MTSPPQQLELLNFLDIPYNRTQPPPTPSRPPPTTITTLQLRRLGRRRPTTPNAPAPPMAAGMDKVPSATSSNATGVISRSISACNRCRSRKTKCDQLFPSCTACTRAGVECVGIDAATGREIPRSYVDWLERRVKHLEGMMELKKEGEDDAAERGATKKGAEKDRGTNDNDGKEGAKALDAGKSTGTREFKRKTPEKAGGEVQTPRSPVIEPPPPPPPPPQRRPSYEPTSSSNNRQPGELRLRPDIENLIDQVGVVGVQGTSATGFMGGTSGISFARLMFSTVKMQSGSESTDPSLVSPPSATTIPKASPPDASVTSTTVPRARQRARPIGFPDRYTAERLIDTYFQQANPQFPILHRPSFEPILQRACARVESGFNEKIITSEQDQAASAQHSADLYFMNMCFAIASAMSSGNGDLPERYHATAMQHMESLFSSISASNNRLDGLKGVLLLALYSMMRPAAPGVWYVLGAALRLTVDLGLHQENPRKAEQQWDPLALDERRRLFWCTYSIDRQVCVYLGRPFGISDDAINTPFPADVSDECITPHGILPEQPGKRSSRTISILMFRIRKLQSEIQRALYQVSELPRKFRDLKEWREDMEARLKKWWDDVPKSSNEAGSGFNLGFVDLNYQQTRLLLYGLCPAVPRPSVEALAIIADSGSRIIQAYGNLHRQKSINYSWLACHNLFMAGTSYLCALWHSPQVRNSTNIEQIDANARTSIEVLGSMIDRCPAALTCRDVFRSLADSTVQLCKKELGTQKLASEQHHKRHNHHQQHTQNSGFHRHDTRPSFSIQPPPQKRIKLSSSNGQTEISPSMPPTPLFSPQIQNPEPQHMRQPPPMMLQSHHHQQHQHQHQRQHLPHPHPHLWTPPNLPDPFPSSPVASLPPPQTHLSLPSLSPQSPSSTFPPISYPKQLHTPISPPHHFSTTSSPPSSTSPALSSSTTTTTTTSSPQTHYTNTQNPDIHPTAINPFAPSQMPWVDLGPRGQMQPMVDGNQLFEMIREVGAVGGWEVGGAGGVGVGVGVGGWGFEGGWGT
ncbi:hypothetical protein EX30DRAFT_398116 [Ascodesmis nigricans]|uniref:Zn(2)-C6 fungal-type domain-containing protein n=1 Tax=Ascodesmis nigricans TaxID=341454 RepID=A0A4S2MM75_9PEZI|nr:hypothetical protein EX30DRAFT_398116 [Ascodesmis nigricans]